MQSRGSVRDLAEVRGGGLRPSTVGLVVLIGCLSTACATSDTPQACKLTHIVDIPISIASGLPVLDVTIGGKSLRVILDTGAQGFVITPEAAERLGLERDYSRFGYSTGLGAQTSYWPTKPVVAQLGPLALKPGPLIVGTVLTGGASNRAEGLLGGELLSAYDLDLDIPRRRMALYEGRRCPTGAAPFAEPSFRVPTGRAGLFRMTVPVLLDGKPVPMLVDTGTSRTLVDATAASVSETDLGADRTIRVNTADPVGLTAHVHRFKAMQLGSDVVENPLLVVGGLVHPGYSGLLGTDYWRKHRVWISYGSETLIVGASAPQ